MKERLKTLTRKTIPMSFDERIHRLNWLIRGWVNYFKLGSIHSKLKALDEWVRNRLRYCIWHHWMTERSRRVDAHAWHRREGTAKRVGRTRKGVA